MNIFNKVTLQSMRRSRTRTLVTVIGVALSAAMITAVATCSVSLLNYLTNGSIEKYGGWHVEFPEVPYSFVQERMQDEGVNGAAVYQNIGYAALEGGKNPDKPYLFVAGFSEEAFEMLPVNLISGRMPETDSEVLVPAHVAANGGVNFAVGDTLTLSVGNRIAGDRNLSQHDSYRLADAAGKEQEILIPQEERTFTVVGICERPAFEEYIAPGYTLITVAGQRNRPDSFSVFITLRNPRQVHTYAASASIHTSNDNSTSAISYPYILNDNVLRFMGLSGDRLINTLLYSVGGILVALIMSGSVFLIYNSFTISLNERTRQFGILASVGATAKQLRNSVLFEGLCIGAAGIPIGMIVGIGSMGLVISVVTKNFGNILYSDVPLTLHVSVSALFGAALVSIITILISAYIPARKAAGTPVMECIRQTNEVKVESEAVEISSLAQRMYGLEGTLALKNFRRNRKRYRSIVLSLVLSIVLFVSTNAFVTYLTQTADQAKVVTDYDIGFSARDMDNDELLRLYDKLKTANGVTKSSYQVVAEYFCTVPSDELSDAYWKSTGAHSPDKTVDLPVNIQFLEDNACLDIIHGLGLSEEEYTGNQASLLAVAKMDDNSKDVKGVSQLSDMFLSSAVNISLSPRTDGKRNPAKTQNTRISCVEFVPPDIPPISGNVELQPYSFQIIVPYSLMDQAAPSVETADVMIKGMGFQSENPSRTAEEMTTMIQAAGVTADYLLLNTYKMLDESRNYIFIANVFAYTFIIMISLIAVANVFNTISTNIKLRRRELAMLRSAGMSDRDFNKMMRFECAFYGIRALLFGLPIAVASSWLIYRGMFFGGGESLQYVFPWGSIGISVFSVLLVIFITMMYAVSKIKKENIIEALRDDMT